MIEFAPRSENLMTYDEAVLYCTFCTHDGYSDWRLPTWDEWRTSSEIIGWWLNDNLNVRNCRVVPVRDA